MRKVTVTDKNVQGLEELTKQLEAVGDAVSGKEMQKVLMRGAKTMQTEIEDSAPVETGRLKESIRAIYPDLRAGEPISVIIMAKGGPNGAPHAHFVEYGTSQGQKPNPFFRNGINAGKAMAAEQIAEGFRELLDKTVEKHK